MMRHVIKVEDLWKIYSDGTVALQGINLEIERDTTCVVAGPNGAGKTTLLRILDGELKATKGFVSVLSMDLEKDRFKINKRIGVMPQEGQLFEDLTVWEHIYYFSVLKGLSRNEARRETARLIDVLELSEKKDALIRNLSGGLKKRVNLAQALAGNNDLTMLDEPTAGLDPEARLSTLKLISDLHRDGKTVIVTTHYLDEVEEYVDKVIILNKGKILIEGSVDKVLNKVGYNLKIELPKTDSLLARLPNQVKYSFFQDKIIFWTNKDEAQKVFPLLKKEEIREIKISRPTLEEAYLNLVKET